MALSAKKQKEVVDLLGTIAKGAQEKDFSPSKKQQKENHEIRNALLGQKGYHRDALLKFIKNMTVASFTLLVMVVIVQMIIRVWNEDYTGVSDSLLKTLVIGVFGQIIGVVASIVIAVWKDAT